VQFSRGERVGKDKWSTENCRFFPFAWPDTCCIAKSRLGPWQTARVGQNRKCIPYMTIYSVTSLPKMTYIHRIKGFCPTLQTRNRQAFQLHKNKLVKAVRDEWYGLIRGLGMILMSMFHYHNV
jgi:hypothetical protein